MSFYGSLRRFIHRFRYPVSLPEDIANSLGLESSHALTFKEIVNKITTNSCCANNLCRLMPREKAEKIFKEPLRIDKFHKNTLISYYFNEQEGWVEFDLHFDSQSRLRRVYLQHKDILDDSGIEVPIVKE